MDNRSTNQIPQKEMSYGKQYTSFRYYLQVVKRLQFVPGVSHTAIRHIMEVLFSAFSLGYKGKAVNFSSHSPCRRIPLARFLNQGKWDSHRLEDLIKASVIQTVYGEALRSGKPVFCIVDDTIASKTKLSSRLCTP